jgi:transglutaminase-like putative cysteine protease
MRRIAYQPAEGWLAVALVAVMSLTVGWSLDDPGWVQGNHAWTDFLPIAAVFGAAAGFLGAKSGWPRWAAHLTGAFFAALILPVLTGWSQQPSASPFTSFGAVSDAAVEAWYDLAILRLPVTAQTLHTLLALGILVWAAGQAMAYSVFGHRRPLDAVVVGGLVLIVNMAATGNDQVRFLVIYSAASLFLLVSMHALDERTTWIRRRIGDPSTISRLYLSGGTVFIVVAVLGSVLLMDRAASAPLKGAWTGVDRWLIDLSDDLQAFLPQGGDQRPGPVSFGNQSRVSGRWYSSNATAFTAKVPVLEAGLYWRVGSWDQFNFPNEWQQSTPQTQTDVKAGDSLIAGVKDGPDETNSRKVSLTVTIDGYTEPRLLSPGSPETVDIASRLVTTPDGQFVGVTRSDDATYTVDALLWKVGNDALNASRLRESSTEYRKDIVDRYTTGWEQSLPAGGAALALRDEIWSGLKSRTPFDFAKAIETRLRNDKEFEYDPNVVDLPCNRDGLAECFADAKRGYCMHFATAMLMMLRSEHIPARLAQGFLPGTVELGTQIETVTMSNAHAWVEVYFPGYGWQPFDPTGGAQGSEALGAALPAGVPSGSATPKPSSSIKDSDTPRPSFEEPDDGNQNLGGVITRPGNPTMLILTAVLLMLVVGGLSAILWWRGPRGEVTPDSAWGTVGKLAARFGFAPRPTQTVYEYASTLGTVVPVAKADLETVARAKVETAYARKHLSHERLRGLREANRRLRVNLLRLVLRRRPRGVRGIRPTR